MDSGQFLYTVISDTLDRELDRKRNLEAKVMSLFRLWIFLLTTFTTIIVFLMNYNSDVIRSLVAVSSYWLSFFIVIFCVIAFILSRLLYLMVSMAAASFGISDKDEIGFKSSEIDSMITSEINSLYSGACKQLNSSIKDYDKHNKKIGESIKESLPRINKLLIALFVILVLLTLIMIVI